MRSNQPAPAIPYQLFGESDRPISASSAIELWDRCNRIAVRCVGRSSSYSVWRSEMSFLKRLFSSNATAPKKRVHVCVECGMPVAEHKDWCSIRRGQVELDQRKAHRQ